MRDLLNKVTQGDCIESMRNLPESSVDLIVIDPPYNIGKDKRWDKWSKVDDYVAFMVEVFKECERVLKPNGSFYWFHNDMVQIRKLMDALDNETNFKYKQFISWNKRYEGMTWIDPNGRTRGKRDVDAVLENEGLRNYKQMAEYCLFYTFQDETGLTKILRDSNFRNLQTYFRECRERLRWSYKKCDEYLGIKASYCYWDKATTHAYRIPTEEHYEKLRQTGAFPRDYEDLCREYEDLRRGYEDLRKHYEGQRYTYNNLKTHHSIWNYPIGERRIGHVTPKPVELIENIIRHSSNPGDVVLDCFLGSGTTAVAAINTGRQFIGIEREPEYVAIANKRIAEAQT